jgi:methyl-accepting chemotaxis protein
MLNNLRITGRLVIGFGILVIMLAGLSGYAVYSAKSTAAAFATSERALKAETMSQRFMRRLAETRQRVWMALATGDEVQWDKANEALKLTHDRHGKLRGLTTDPVLLAEVDELGRLVAGYEAELVKLRALRARGVGLDSPEMQALLATANTLGVQITAVDEKLTPGYAKAAQEASDAITSEIGRTIDLSIAMGIASVLIGVFLSILISRSVAAPLGRLVDLVGKVESTGDLSLRADITGKDEVANTGSAFNALLDTLETSFQEITEVATLVSDTAEQLNSASQCLASTSEEQSSAVEEVTSSVEETDSQVRANTDAANAANQLVMGTSAAAAEGQSKMNAMVASMNDINGSAQNIAKIIKVIDEIAFQTNLLALNAAVEAARAGQHGRGFAVVAQEVRNLAGRSAKAARETAELIEGSVKQVEAGVGIAGQTSQALDLIVGNIVKVKDLVGEIAAASMEQSRGVSQINVAINQVAKSAQESSQQAEELASSSSEMTSASGRLIEEIRRFKLSQRRSGGAPRSERLSPQMLAQIKAMVGSPAAHQLQGSAEARGGYPALSKPAKRSPKAVLPLDHDERGFGDF